MEKHAFLKNHADEELGLRVRYNKKQNDILADSSGEAEITANSITIYNNEYWKQIDRSVAEHFSSTNGREIYLDLEDLKTVLPLHKVVAEYYVAGDISNQVSVSMDGGEDVTYDNVGLVTDGDPIPVFATGFGVDWRRAGGSREDNLGIMLKSKNAKMDTYLATLNTYLLNGSDKIASDNYKGEGLKNHRNTFKLDLGTDGKNIDLTSDSTTNDQIVSFFTRDFAAMLDDNNIPAVDVLWVSKEVAARMSEVFSKSDGFKAGTLLENVLKLQPRIKSIKTSYTTKLVSEANLPAGASAGLSGNEFLAYVKSKTFIEIPVGQPVKVVPIERKGPRDNFNNEILTAFGVQVKKQGDNFGVFFGANIT